MPTSPYSLDLRERVIKYIEGGKSQKLSSILFELNPSTVSRWWLRYKREGHYIPRKRIGKSPRVSAIELRNYIEAKPNFKTSEMGKHFGISSVGAYYWLKKLGYSYKKKPLPMWKQTKRSA
jgi:transposase